MGEVYRVARRHAHLVYVAVERVFSERRTSILANALNPRKWWSIVKAAVFGASSSLPLLVDKGCRLVWSADLNASLFLAHFDVKQCRDSFQQPHSCDPSLLLCSVGFRSSFVRRLLLNLGLYSGNDPDGMIPHF